MVRPAAPGGLRAASMKRMLLRIAFLALLSLQAAACLAQAVPDGPGGSIPIIDAHSQFDQFVETEEIMHWLNKGGVSRVILSDRSTGMIDRGAELLSLSARHPGRITPAIRTKPPGYHKMAEQEFARYLARQATNPEYGALAEIILTHAAMRNPYFSLGQDIEIPPSNHQARTAAALAKRKNWPLLLHIEFRYIRGRKALFMEELEKLLAEDRGLPVGLMHMGQLEAKEAERLIGKHPNVFFMLSMANPVINAQAARNDPFRGWVDIFRDGELKPEWRDLMLAFPDRFVLAFDNVFKAQWSGLYVQQIALWRRTLATLPDPVAHAIAHANAEGLWRLPPAEPFLPR